MKIEKSNITEMNRLHLEIEQALRKSLSNAVQIGQHLEEVKESLPHGQFTGFIIDNLSFSVRTAQNYMKLYQHREQLAGAESVQEAYKLLSGKNETVSHLETKKRPLFESKNLADVVQNWWDQRAPLALILDAAGWSVEDIAEKFKQPVENISAIIDPTPHQFRANDSESAPPVNWDRAVDGEISYMLSEQYKRAAEKAPAEGYPGVVQHLQVLAKHHKKRAERLKWYETIPWDFEVGELSKSYERDLGVAAMVLLLLTVRDALGIQKHKLAANWLCNIVEIKKAKKNEA